MPLVTANQFQLAPDVSGLANRISQIVDSRKVEQKEILRQNLKTTGAHFLRIRDLPDIHAKKKEIADLATAAFKRGEDIEVYDNAMLIQDPDELNNYLMRIATRATDADKLLEKGLQKGGGTKVLGKDDKLVSETTGETIAEGKSSAADVPGYKFVKDIPIGGGQFRAGYVPDDPNSKPIFTSEAYEKKALIDQTIHTGGKLPPNYRWTDPNDESQGVTPIEGGPADPSIRQENTYDETISILDKAEGSLDRYEKLFDEHGTKILPDAAKQELGAAYAAMQLEIKELDKLGVLAGPDMKLIERIMTDPLTFTGAAYEYFGGKEGFKSQIGLVRNKLNQARATAERLYGKKQTRDTAKPAHPEGTIIVNPTTNERMIMRGGQWQPTQQ